MVFPDHPRCFTHIQLADVIDVGVVPRPVPARAWYRAFRELALGLLLLAMAATCAAAAVGVSERSLFAAGMCGLISATALLGAFGFCREGVSLPATFRSGKLVAAQLVVTANEERFSLRLGTGDPDEDETAIVLARESALTASSTFSITATFVCDGVTYDVDHTMRADDTLVAARFPDDSIGAAVLVRPGREKTALLLTRQVVRQ